MKAGVVVAVIAAFPPTMAAALGYLASRRSLRRTLGPSPGIPLTQAIQHLDEKVDRLGEGQADIRERLARLESVNAVVRARRSRLRG